MAQIVPLQVDGHTLGTVNGDELTLAMVAELEQCTKVHEIIDWLVAYAHIDADAAWAVFAQIPISRLTAVWQAIQSSIAQASHPAPVRPALTAAAQRGLEAAEAEVAARRARPRSSLLVLPPDGRKVI